MKITLVFSEHEDKEAKTALRAGEYAAAIDDVYNYIRGILKHTEASEELIVHLGHIRDLLPSTEV